MLDWICQMLMMLMLNASVSVGEASVSTSEDVCYCKFPHVRT